MDLKVNFSGRSIKYTEEEISVVVDAMRNAQTLTQGQYLSRFEEAFAKYIGVEKGTCFAVMNGCSALEMSAQLCCFNKGDEVVIPSHTFTASAYPYLKKGATPVWADIDLETRVVTAESIEKVLTKKTKAVVVVHLYGYLANMPEIQKLCKEKNIILIEDAAQAIGTELNGKKAGSFGDMSIFSFHSHKNMTTLGEGGMLYVANKEIAKIIPALRHNGHCAYDFDRDYYWKPAMGNVDMPMLNGVMLEPNNYSIGEIECALGIKLLDRIDIINDQKRERALKFIDVLKETCPELEFHRVSSRRHNYHLLVARMINGQELRDKFINKMYHEKGIKCVVQYIPLDRYDYYKKLGFDKSSCPNADKFFDTMVSFPFQHWLSDEEFNYMLESSVEVMKSIRF